MKENTKRRKFRTFFISKDLQRPIIYAHLAYILLVAVALIATVLFPLYNDMLGSDDLWTKHFSEKIFIALLERLPIAGLIITVISVFYFVILTHKFCGPLVNIEKTIERISERDFTRKVYLRQGDFLKNEAKQVNAMMTNAIEFDRNNQTGKSSTYRGYRRKHSSVRPAVRKRCKIKRLPG